MRGETTVNQDDDFFDNAPCGCVVLELDGAFVRTNATFRSMAAPPETKPSRFQQVLCKAGAIYDETQFVPALRLRGSLKEVAFDLVRPGRERLPVLINANLKLATTGYPMNPQRWQIVANLVGNAFDAMHLGGRLRLRSRHATVWKTGAKGIRLTIADTGTGTSAALLPRIFEPFFSTKGIGGTELGLWIVQELINKNRGSIRVRSSVHSKSSGTVVCLLLEQ